jgi:minimal PKS acyl carrier protein
MRFAAKPIRRGAPVSTFTIADLSELMRSCTGYESTALDEGALGQPFPDLGWDSLAVLELTVQINRRWSVPFPDEIVERMKTPEDVLGYVNTQLAA